MKKLAVIAILFFENMKKVLNKFGSTISGLYVRGMPSGRRARSA